MSIGSQSKAVALVGGGKRDSTPGSAKNAGAVGNEPRMAGEIRNSNVGTRDRHEGSNRRMFQTDAEPIAKIVAQANVARGEFETAEWVALGLRAPLLNPPCRRKWS